MKQDKIIIELLKHQELSLFQEFIKINVSPKHIFARDHSVFDWQHKNVSTYSCMSAKHDGKLVGSQGFIPLSHFDEGLPENQIFLVLFKVKEGIRIGLGFQLYKEIINRYSPDFIATLGFNKRMKDFHIWQKFNVGIMDHHVALSPYRKIFQIAKVPKKLVHLKQVTSTKITFKKVNDFDLQALNTANLFLNQTPFKSDKYIKNRFMDHPVYKYDVYAIMKSRRLIALCVLRPILQDGVTVLRFVDFMGPNEAFCLLSDFIFSMIKVYEAEYLDIYSFGVPSEFLIQAGFVKRSKVEGLIIPNYFEPFEKKNIDITFAYKTSKSLPPVRLFKADADQDRPSQLK